MGVCIGVPLFWEIAIFGKENGNYNDNVVI